MTAAARPGKAVPAAGQDGRDAPPYYIATTALYIGAARAHAVGARVSPVHVAKYGWQNKVRRPDEPPAAPTAQSATDESQTAATTKNKEG